MTLLAWALSLLVAVPAVAALAHAWQEKVTPASAVPVPAQWWPALVGAGVPVLLLGVAAWLAWDAAPARGDAVPPAVLVCALAAVVGGGPVATGVLLLADPRTRRPRRPPGGTTAPGTPSATPSASATPPLATPPSGRGPGDPDVLRGGAWIGVMERLAVLGSLLSGEAEGVAIVLAVKGLGRYPDLRGPGAAERFIIGTFASVLWAAACAGVGLLLLS